MKNKLEIKSVNTYISGLLSGYINMKNSKGTIKKSGMDLVWYTFEVYEKHLFPYYLELQALDPRKTMYITENNIDVHHRAQKLLAPYIESKKHQIFGLSQKLTRFTSN